MLEAAVVSTESASSTHLRACLQQTGFVSGVREWELSSEQHPKPGESIPDIVLLDITHDSQRFFAFATRLRQLRPAICIIACSPLQQPDPDLLLQAMRSGVREFLPKPVNPEALRAALESFVRETGERDTGTGEKLIVVVGAKGGVGTSTVAVNLGVQLTQISRKRVVLLDYARPVGHASLLLDLQPRFSIRDAVENLERLDGHLLGGLLVRHKTRLEVLAGTSHAEEWERITGSALARVASVAQSSFDFVVIDYGSLHWEDWSSLAPLARTVLLVAEANVPALWALERHLTATSALGLDPNRVRVVINRWSRRDEEVLKTVEKNIKRPIFIRLHNDYRQVSEATNLGVPLSANHNNRLVGDFRQLASRLAGVTFGVPARKNGLTTLFSRR